MFSNEDLLTNIGVGTAAAGLLFYHCAIKNKYQSELPIIIQNNIDNVIKEIEDKNSISVISSALLVSKNNFSVEEKKIDAELLKKLANEVNGSSVHFSGNCLLLSACLLFNLKVGKNILAARNIFPIFYPMLKGIDSEIVNKIIFGSNLICVEREIKGVNRLTEVILQAFKEKNERFFQVTLDYDVPIMGSFGHALNAVVMEEKDGLKILYVDSWKTSQYVYSIDELQKKYQYVDVYFGLTHYPGILPYLQKEENNSISLVK